MGLDRRIIIPERKKCPVLKMGDVMSALKMTFTIIIEPDAGKFSAYCPGFVEEGAATWGHTPGEALVNLMQALAMVIDSIGEHGK